MSRVEGESPIHITKLSALPADARHVLHIRSEVQKQLQEQGGMETPVDHLIVEASREDLMAEGAQVVHPIAFLLPTVFLRALSNFEQLPKVEFP